MPCLRGPQSCRSMSERMMRLLRVTLPLTGSGEHGEGERGDEPDAA